MKSNLKCYGGIVKTKVNVSGNVIALFTLPFLGIFSRVESWGGGNELEC